MAPEQARDATSVDHRADIYSLGCTLYVLLTGRPVFEGTTAARGDDEARRRTRRSRPERLNKEVPRALSDITLRMIAKKPDDRYATMDEVIEALEDFLGLHGARQAGHVRGAHPHPRTGLRGVPAGPRRPAAVVLLLGFFGGCAVLFLLLALFEFWKGRRLLPRPGRPHGRRLRRRPRPARRSPVFLKLRDWSWPAAGSSWRSWPSAGLLLLGVLYLARPLLGLARRRESARRPGAGPALRARPAHRRRAGRGAGQGRAHAQDAAPARAVRGGPARVRRAIAGDHWEEVFEALFGYEAKLAARAAHGRGPKGWRPRHAGLARAASCRASTASSAPGRRPAQRRHLREVEQKGLEAQGVGRAGGQGAGRARRRGDGPEGRRDQEGGGRPAAGDGQPTARGDRPRRRHRPRLRKAPPHRASTCRTCSPSPPSPDGAGHRTPILPVLLAVPFGSTTRFFVAAALLVLCLAWLSNRDLLPGSADAGTTGRPTRPLAARRRPRPWSPGLPAEVSRAVSSLNAGVAGLALLLSVLWRSWKIGVLVLLGAAVMVIGPVSGDVPEVGPLTPSLACLAGGGAVVVAGFLGAGRPGRAPALAMPCRATFADLRGKPCPGQRSLAEGATANEARTAPPAATAHDTSGPKRGFSHVQDSARHWCGRPRPDAGGGCGGPRRPLAPRLRGSQPRRPRRPRRPRPGLLPRPRHALLSGGYYYRGQDHHHWQFRVWDARYHRYHYWDPT